MNLEVADSILPMKETQRKKKHKSDNDFVVNGELIGVTVGDTCVESNKESKKKKKKEKREGSDVDLSDMDIDLSRKKEKKRKRESRNKAENHEGNQVGVDDHPVKKRKKMNKNNDKDENESDHRIELGIKDNKKHNEIDQKNEESMTSQKDLVGEKNVVNDKKKRNKRKDKLDGNDESLRRNSSGELSSNDEKSPNLVEESNTNSGKKKKSKHAIEISRDVLEKLVEEKDMAVDSNMDSCASVKEMKKKKQKSSLYVEAEKSNKISSKKAKSVKEAAGKNIDEGKTGAKDREESAGGSEKTKPSKKVKFSGDVEIFPISDIRNVEKYNQDAGLLRGKRFSKDEDQILQDAVLKYIEEHDLGDDGINKVMRCRNYPEIRNCWKEISPVMPWRTQTSIYSRAHILFERALEREWTLEEKEDIRKYFEKHGPQWRQYADEHGKSRIHVKDTWRRINVPEKKTGPWSQEEYQNYFDLVNMDLRMKVFGEKKSKHGMLRDDIAWGAISERLSSRSNTECCRKWYNQLASPLVQEKIWSDLDDYRLLNELAARDFSSVEEVDWDNLLDHRPGDISRKRWFQMVNHLGEHGNKAFADQLEVLLSRYCPDVQDAREIYHNKTPVDC